MTIWKPGDRLRRDLSTRHGKKGSICHGHCCIGIRRPHVHPHAAIHVPSWAWALLAVAVFTLYVLSQENGALLSAPAAEMLHELTHDARHALGVPCH